MIKLAEPIRTLLNNALADGAPCLVGTATQDGKPQISPKGSVAVYDDQRLCYWERSMRSALNHIGENPNVVVYQRPFFGSLRTRGSSRDSLYVLSDGAILRSCRTVDAQFA